MDGSDAVDWFGALVKSERFGQPVGPQGLVRAAGRAFDPGNCWWGCPTYDVHQAAIIGAKYVSFIGVF